jgi:hypothetical protein
MMPSVGPETVCFSQFFLVNFGERVVNELLLAGLAGRSPHEPTRAARRYCGAQQRLIVQAPPRSKVITL